MMHNFGCPDLTRGAIVSDFAVILLGLKCLSLSVCCKFLSVCRLCELIIGLNCRVGPMNRNYALSFPQTCHYHHDRSFFGKICVILVTYIAFCNIVAGQDATMIGKIAPFPHLDNVLNRETSGPSACIPSYVCKDVDIFQIPYLFEHMNPSFVNPQRNNLFDTKRTQMCLNNKRILVLGDSVLEEFVLDLATLLSGVASNTAELDSFIHDSGAKSPHHLLHKLPNGVTVYHHNSRRNMTVISDEADTYVRHRFTGHYNIKENYYGMRTLVFPQFVGDELECLLGLVGSDIECPVPDIIVLNGG